ncbi:MAG: site-specific integrase [Methanomassiliicoccales archaeon]|nr:site-specific integrase [Methanomassiliicoccales archaeon]
MGRFPCVCAYRRYLNNARARLGESTIKERERKLHFISTIVQDLKERGTISTSNPYLFTENDVIEIFMTLRNRTVKGRPPKLSTIRKQMQLLKDVCLDGGNRKVEDLLRIGRIRIGNDHREPFSLDRDELLEIFQACKEVGGWRGETCRFAAAMFTFLQLRPGELQKALLSDIDTRKWTFLVSNPKGKDLYGEVRRLQVPDVLKPFVLDFLEARETMLRSKGISCAEPLIPAVSCKGVGCYTQQAFARLKKEIIKRTGIAFKWKDFRPTGGQLALDGGVPIEQVSQSMRHTSTKTTERYYCRTKADLAFARVNETYNSMFRTEPAIKAEND